jgi:hypothetical protein
LAGGGNALTRALGDGLLGEELAEFDDGLASLSVDTADADAAATGDLTDGLSGQEGLHDVALGAGEAREEMEELTALDVGVEAVDDVVLEAMADGLGHVFEGEDGLHVFGGLAAIVKVAGDADEGVAVAEPMADGPDAGLDEVAGAFVGGAMCGGLPDSGLGLLVEVSGGLSIHP